MEVDTEPQTVDEQADHVDQSVEQPEQAEQVEETSEVEPQEDELHEKEQMVPLTALQKERNRRKEEQKARMRYEVENQFYKEQMSRKEPEEPDYSLDEPLTKGEARKLQEDADQRAYRKLKEELQKRDEGDWISKNPEAYEYVLQNLENFLEQKPNLTSAINESPNRYKEAFELMQALSPRQKKQMQRQTAKKQAPGSPNSVPKAANVSQVVDLYSMSDEEYNAWRAEKRRRR